MTAQALIYIVNLTILLSVGFTNIQAQQAIYPDSVIMLTDSETDQIGYIFPEKIAIDYRNLLKRTIPLMETKIRMQNILMTKDSERIVHLNHIKALLKMNIESEMEKTGEAEQLAKNIKKEFDKERRKRIFWQYSSYGVVLLSGLVLLSTQT